MKYPAIIRNDNEIEMLLFNEDNAIILSGIHKGELHDVYPRFRNRYKNITHEYLSNTWGVVESKEHAEFIIELAELHGLELLKDGLSNKNYFHIGEKSFALFINKPTFIGGCKQITIPLPPKSVKSEWPQVGDEVVTRGGSKGVLMISKPDNDGMVICDFDGEYALSYLSELQKPKSPEEELRDEISDLAFNQFNDDSYDLTHNSYYLAEQLISKYNITKKDKGDE